MRTGTYLALLLVSAAAAVAGSPPEDSPHDWSEGEQRILESLWIGSLGAPPPSPGNAVAGEPAAAAFGHELFFDTRLSGNGAVACATCHQPARRFTDGLQKARGMGTAGRNAPSIVGSAWSPWLYWDGRRDSLWSQALTPMEDINEHGTTRRDVVRLVVSDPEYHDRYRSVFGEAPSMADGSAIDRTFANIGKAIAAYERLLVPGPSRFDRYVEAVVAGDTARQQALFDADEVAGLKLFIGKAECMQCHNGPLLTNNEFHNTGTAPFPGDPPDEGRYAGTAQVREDPFNCLGDYSDAGPGDCAELEFMLTGPQLRGAFRTPSLRNLAHTAPYMHKGQLWTLRDVLEHYNEAPPAAVGHSDIRPLGLDDAEIARLEAFLETLDAPLATDAAWLAPPRD